MEPDEVVSTTVDLVEKTLRGIGEESEESRQYRPVPTGILNIVV